MTVTPRILPDDHDEMIELFLNAAQERLDVTGVVHVGAHRGQEVSHYRAHGIAKIALVEANPEHCAFLSERFGDDADVTVINCAVGEADGFVDLNINVSRSGNDESSSILPLGRLATIVPNLQTRRTVRVPMRTLDTLSRGAELANCNFLSMDIQGAELRALYGARRALHNVRAVLIETNLIEMYEGCALEAAIDAELAAYGFSCVERVYHELYEGAHRFPAWGESLYVRD